MRILWVKNNLLHPPDSGGKLRSYNTLRHLSEEHEVIYLAYESGGPEAVSRAEEYCDRLVTLPWDPPPGRRSVGFVVEAAANLFSSMPLSLDRYDTPALRRAARELSVDLEADVVVADFLTTAPAVARLSDVPTVLFQHNVEAVIWERMAESATTPLRPYYRLQAKRMRSWERRLVGEFDHVVAVSRDDAENMKERYGLSDVGTVPTGVDISYFRPSEASEYGADGQTVLFIGSLDWLPNIDGLKWFVDESWPRVRSRVPDARLEVVGRRPTDDLKKALEPLEGVTISPDVPDVRPYLERATVVIVPLKVGSGTRLKIYEAMAAGRAVVSTSVGAEGLPLEDGRHIVLEDSAEGFARSVVRLLDEPARRERLASTGCEYVRENFGWERVAARFADLCRNAVRRHRARSDDGTGQ